MSGTVFGGTSNPDRSGGLNVAWGANGDIPMVADLDGDGRADLILYRPSAGRWFALYSSGGYNPDRSGGLNVAWGANGDIPMVADLDGDGRADLILYRPSAGRWFALYSSGGYNPDQPGGLNVAWGASEDLPMVANLDGDRHADLILYRPSAGRWFALLWSTINSITPDPGATSFQKNFDLTWFEFPYGCHTETDTGDVILPSSYHLGGSDVGAVLPLNDITGVAYDDGFVKVENLRKTDHDTLTITKGIDKVTYTTVLTACTGDGGAHRYIRITLHGQK